MSTRSIALQGIGFGALLVALQGFAPLVQDQTSGGAAPNEYNDHSGAFALKGEIDRQRQEEANARGRALKKAQAEAVALLKQQAEDRAQQVIADEAAAYRRLHEPLSTGPALADEIAQLGSPEPDVAMAFVATQDTTQVAPDANFISLADDNENRRRIALLLLLLG